jgi:ribose transport system permease protein
MAGQLSGSRPDATASAGEGGVPAQAGAPAPGGGLASLGVLNPAGWLRRSDAADVLAADRRGRRTMFDRFLDLGIYVALIGLCLYFWIASPFFLTQQNLLNIGAAVAVIGVLAAGMTIALIAGQLDLTVGANVALTSVIVALTMQNFGLSTLPAAVLGLVVGLGIGAANSLLIVGVGINSIIATLAMSIVIRGVALILTNGQVVPIANLGLPNFVNDRFIQVPSSVWVLIVVFVVSWLVLTFTRAGWHIYGVGGNASAALRAGIRTKRLYVGVFMVTGLLAALGGIITAGTSAGGGPNYAVGVEFNVLTAVLLGGIGLGGGSGKVQRTLAGVLVIGILNNGLILLNVSSYYQQLAQGGVFVLAVVLAAIAERRRAR